LGSRGKPALAIDRGDIDLRYNFSHTRGLALYAIACGREVRVDIERIRIALGLDQLEATVSSTRERAVLAATEPDWRHAYFFGTWTRKEAFVKAVYQGLFLPPDRLDVVFGPAPWA
jgi:4'-phosphopantetheinyl transferase